MIRVVGFVDTTPALAAYHTKFKAQFEPVETIPGLSGWLGEPGEWKSLSNLVARIQGLVTTETEVDTPRAWFLEPGAIVPWDREPEDGGDRFTVALAAGPGCSLTVGPVTTPIVVGQVLHFNPTNLHTAANFGPVPLIALTVDLHALSDRTGIPAQADS